MMKQGQLNVMSIKKIM